MKIQNQNKKGQGLPLQTIVIAILVIIVLLVLVVFFVSKMGSTGSEIDKQTGKNNECDISNPALNMIYKHVEEDDGMGGCAEDYKPVPGIKGCCGTTKE